MSPKTHKLRKVHTSIDANNRLSNGCRHRCGRMKSVCTCCVSASSRTDTISLSYTQIRLSRRINFCRSAPLVNIICWSHEFQACLTGGGRRSRRHILQSGSLLCSVYVFAMVIRCTVAYFMDRGKIKIGKGCSTCVSRLRDFDLIKV